MKKVLSLVLAIMMVMSLMTTAFAGTFEDIEDKDVAKAVDALSSLGVVNGNPDGTYKPENGVTRGEMVKLLVVALGHGDLAADSKSAFSDSQGKWFDGYAAVAQALGITNGTGAGKFSGDAQIKYTEVITMIMRALGYNDRAVNANRENVYNATSYKTTAARLGVLKGVTFSANTANRGDVALMIYNALEVQVVVPNEDGNPVGQWLVAPAVGEIGTVRTLLDDIAKRSVVTITTADLFGANVADVSSYLGEEVVAYLNKDGEIVFVKSSVDATKERIVSGTISATSTVANSFTVKKADKTTKTYNVSGSSITFIVNNVEETKTGAAAVAALQAIKPNFHSIKVVNASNSEDLMTVVVENINYTLQSNSTYVEGKTKFQGINLPTKDGKVNDAKILFEGDATSLEDIEENDVVQAAVGLNSNGTTNNVKFYVTRNTIEGKVEEVDSINGVYVINSEEYELNNTGNAITTLALDAEGTFFLDKDGYIAFDAAKTGISNYGIITAYNDGTVGQSFGTWGVTKAPQVKMVGADGKTKVYDVVVKASTTDPVTTANGFVVTTNVAGEKISVAVSNAVKSDIEDTTGATGDILVKYTLNEDGKITNIAKANLGTALQSGTKEDAKFLADSNTIILGRADDGKYSLVSLDKLTTGSIKYQVLTNSSNFKWDYVIITEGINAASTIKTYAVITGIADVTNSAGSTVQKVTAFVDGVKTSYVTNGDYTFVEANMYQVLALKFNASGILSGIDTPNPLESGLAVTASAINSDNTVIKVVDGLNNTKYHTLSKDVVVYKENSNGTMSVADLNDIRVFGGTAKVLLFTKATTAVDVIVIKQ